MRPLRAIKHQELEPFQSWEIAENVGVEKIKTRVINAFQNFQFLVAFDELDIVIV